MLDRTQGLTIKRVISLVQDILTRNGIQRIVPETAQLTDIGLTSIDMVNLMLAVEVEFDVLIPPADITPENFRSLSTIEALLVRIGATIA